MTKAPLHARSAADSSTFFTGNPGMHTDFTLYAGLLGGALIGLAAVVMMAGAGRIAGCSGIFRSMLTAKPDADFIWRALFVAGLIGGVILARPYAPNAQAVALPSLAAAVIGGFCVGAGTSLSNGCTSGHGICGISRFSIRSLVATLTFMVVAIITVYITHHVIGG
ncbi:MAG: YeeE/YedE family protein [Alphaproteobacteria bacterium]|nr:YeeE/YedE family protein [Alphaproteobacteria bacterium]